MLTGQEAGIKRWVAKCSPTFGKLELSERNEPCRVLKKTRARAGRLEVAIDGRTVSVEGPKGKLQLDLPDHTKASLEDGHWW